MPSEISKFNLEKDKNVQGLEWAKTYGGYFSDESNIDYFINTVLNYLPNKHLDILYTASASGLLGERLVSKLGKGSLTIVDISQKHLDANVNLNTKKICADLLELDLSKKFDLIIMRSSLDYFPSEELQIKVLKNISKHLNINGIFINQPAFISDIKDRDLISRAYNSVGKIGKRLFQSTDINNVYLQAGFSIPEKIGEGSKMKLTEEDHISRYEISVEDVDAIKSIMKNVTESGGITEKGYSMIFEFPIFISKINK